MNRRTWVGLIGGVAVVGVLAFAVWTQSNPGPPKLKALAGMKPSLRVVMSGWPTDVYVFRANSAAVRRGVEADLKSLGFTHAHGRAPSSEWLRSGWVVSVLDGQVGKSEISGWGVHYTPGPKSPNDPLTVTISRMPEPTFLDRLKSWLGL